MSLISRPCTIVRRNQGFEEWDEYGDETVVETRELTVCELQQRSRTEPGGQGELSQTEWVLFLPAGTEVDTSDAIIVEGSLYEFVGDPWFARNPLTGRESHVEATVKRAGPAEGESAS